MVALLPPVAPATREVTRRGSIGRPAPGCVYPWPRPEAESPGDGEEVPVVFHNDVHRLDLAGWRWQCVQAAGDARVQARGCAEGGPPPLDVNRPSCNF